MKKLQAFFNELLDKEEIEVSPFQRLGRKRKAQVMKETYDGPRYLHKEEFLKIMDTEVPETLRENTRKVEIETPILKFALEIIKKYNFSFPLLNYAGGENGYNVKIRPTII
ncbi:MAG: hypothetical protein LIP09_07180 [Bacteroidales bacterium]|nr:hypothetical protein [Bacteroidales bacterium]